MDGPVFDAMLKTALEEALRQDLEEAPEAPAPSRRQKKRMRRLLADPRRAEAGFSREETAGRRRTPARWIAVAVIAALLGGAAAAGAVLGNGEWFRSMFENSDSAEYYGGAADTEQLTGMGATIDTPVVEHDGLRFEILDAVFEGQRLMVSAKLSLLAPELLGRLQEGYELNSFDEINFLPEWDGGSFESLSVQLEPWDKETVSAVDQFSMVFDITRSSLGEGKPVSFLLKDFYLAKETEGGSEEALWPGEWTLTVTPQPVEPLLLEPKRICQVDGVDWMLDSVDLSPLTLQFSLHCLARERQDYRDASEGLEIHMKDGTVVDRRGCSGSASGGGHTASARLDFPMPLDLEQVDFLRICGEDIYLEE